MYPDTNFNISKSSILGILYYSHEAMEFSDGNLLHVVQDNRLN